MSPTITSIIVLLVAAAGFGYYVRVAQTRKSSKVEEFFVAGRNIGLPLFTQTNWGSSFAFGNSIFYAIWLGYSVGLSALWVQALWAVGMTAYALLLPRLVKYTQNYTLHGFLGSSYGSACRVTASIISVIGLLILLGFELSFVAQYFSQVTNLQHLEWLVVLALAIFVATFCNIGGFKANTVTDRISNYFALGALLCLLLLTVTKHHTALAQGFTPKALWSSAGDFSSSSILYFIGLGVFALFNIVDMSNWQNVSANSLDDDLSPASQAQRNNMKWAMLKAAALFLFAPVLTGTVLGYMLRVLQIGTTDQNTFMSHLVFGVLPTNPVLSVLILSVLTFAFLASSLAGTDSWLLASTQTLSWDLIDYKRFRAAGFKVSNFDQVQNEGITRRGRLILMIVGVGGASIVYYISKYVWDQVFALQFVIFGGGLAMLPALLFGIFRSPISEVKILPKFALMSIIVGYGCALGLFGYSLVTQNPDAVSPLPVVVLVTAFSIFLLGLILSKALRK
jgi:Na+/proline symporter